MSATPCGQAGDLKEMPAAKSAGKKNPGSAATRTGKFINKTRGLIVCQQTTQQQ